MALLRFLNDKDMVLAMPALFSHQPGRRLKIWVTGCFPARLPCSDRAITAEGDRQPSEIADFAEVRSRFP